MAFQAAIAGQIAIIDQGIGSVPASPDEAYQRMTQVQRAAREGLMTLAIGMDTTVATLTAQMAALTEAAAHRPTGGHGGRRPLSEHKCVSNLKMLGADREEFKS